MSATGTQDEVELSLSEAQDIAESIVGSVRWRGQDGFCVCPGETKHSTRGVSTDCKVVAEAIHLGGGTLAPGVYCFHDSCRGETEDASLALRKALGRRCPATGPRPVRSAPKPKAPDSIFDPSKLREIARRMDGIDEGWFAARSRKAVHNRTPASFLHELYKEGENVVVFDDFQSQGQAVWSHPGWPFDAGALDHFCYGAPDGVWFLANPVTGQFVPNDDGKLSRRSWQTVTSWRYLVLESDKANPEHWLAALAQLPLPIAAIYTSGGKSIHALVKVDADSKAQWDSIAAELKPWLVVLGADRKAISAVRLTRLPCCERVSKGQIQRLLYLNGAPSGAPICTLPVYPKMLEGGAA